MKSLFFHSFIFNKQSAIQSINPNNWTNYGDKYRPNADVDVAHYCTIQYEDSHNQQWGI